MILEQNIDTTKELKFYTSKIITVGVMFLSVVVGFVIAKHMFWSNYNSLQVDPTIGGLLLLCSFLGIIWSTYILIARPIRLMISKDGIYLPKTGNLLWGNIKDISVRLTAEYGEDPMLLKIKLTDGKSYNLIAGLFIRIDTRKLLEILRTYHTANTK